MGLINRFDGLEKIIGKMFDAIIKKDIAKSSSPIILTEFGITLKEKIDVDSLVEKYAKHLQIADGANEYHIQKSCFDFTDNYLLDLVSDKERDALENLAFEEGIPLDKVLRVCGIRLRDYKFKELGKKIPAEDKPEPNA